MNLEDLAKCREDNRLEIKKAKHGLPISVWESYSSFANCGGGVIALGITERRDGSFEISGVEDVWKLQKEFWDIINNPNKVSANIMMEKDIEIMDTKNGAVLLLHVPMAHRSLKPIYLNHDMLSGTYRRSYEGDYRCTPSEVKAMLRDQPEETMDMKVLMELELDALDANTIAKFRNRHMVFRPGHVWEELEDATYLERIGAASYAKQDGKLHPTAAGLLMFGQEYIITREFPEYFLDYREQLDPALRWSDRLYSTTGDWSGNLYDFFFLVYNKLIRDLKVPFKLEGVSRIDDTPVHKAIREALANCLINTDYYGRCGIVIHKDLTTITFENPGFIRIGKEQMKKGGISDPRNKILMKMFNMISIGERAGSGVPNIFDVWKKEGWISPELQEQYNPDRTSLTLSFEKATIKSDDKKATIKNDDKSITPKTNEQLQQLASCMKDGILYSLEDLMQITGVKKTRTKELVYKLVDRGKIIKLGNNKNRRYTKAK